MYKQLTFWLKCKQTVVLLIFLTWEIRRLLRLQWRLYWRIWRIAVRLTFGNFRSDHGLSLRVRISGLNRGLRDWGRRGRWCRRFLGGRFFLVRIIDDVPSTAAKRNRGHDFHHFEAVGGTVGRVRQRKLVPEKLKKNSSKKRFFPTCNIYLIRKSRKIRIKK